MDISERKDLQEADLQGADLIEANLRGANLQGANLIEAHLEGTNLEGANLEGAKNFSFNQLSKVKTLYATILDEELLISLKEKYLPFLKNLINDLVSPNNE